MRKILVLLCMMPVLCMLISCSGPIAGQTQGNIASAVDTVSANTKNSDSKNIDDNIMITIPNIDTNYVRLDDINPEDVPEIKLGLDTNTFTPIIEETGDGFLLGYITGVAVSPAAKEILTTPRIRKLDREGKVIWEKDYDYKTYSGRINNILACPDGSFIFSVQTYPYYMKDGSMVYEKSYIIKCDGSGEQLWKAEFDDYCGGLLEDVFLTERGEIIAAGWWRVKDGRVDKFDGADDIVITKLDGGGNVLVQKSFGGSDFDSFSTARYDSRSGIVIGGSSQSHDGDFSIDGVRTRADFIACIDDSLNVKWVSTAGGKESFIYDQLELSDGFVYVLGGSIATGTPSSGFIIKLDGNGNRVWEKTDIYSEYWGRALSILKNGDIAVGAGGQNKGTLMIFDKHGSIKKQYEGLEFAPEKIIPTTDGGFIAVSTRDIKTVPQPAYISSIWYDTEVVAAKYDRYYTAKWRKTYDNHKDVRNMEFVLPLGDGSILVE